MSGLWPFAFVVPVILGVVIYQLDSFDPAPYPVHELTQGRAAVAPKRNGRLLRGSEKIGVGRLSGPEDIAYDPKTGVIYTGCMDGWIKRVTVNESSAADSVVEDWVNTGGRPLGLAHGLHGEVIVADADIGLLNVTSDGKVQLLTDEAEGVKFKLTDAVDVAEDGMLYFTDASWKYRLKDFFWDACEGRPHGRLLSYNPNTKQTKVLLKHLFFANGVAVSPPDQNSVIFCETPLRRCKKFYIKGERKGSVEVFIGDLPGSPDNIRYDGEGLFWIGLVTGLLNVTSDGKVQLLTDEADGVKFKLTDAVDVAEDGLLYFTDASWKYKLHDFIWDLFDGRPHGRLLSYDPHTKQTKVLVKELFFANGVAVFPDQSFVIFCETALRRCKRFYLKGEKKGSVDVFIENLPGMPDNIRYDGEGLFWIALATEYTYSWELAQKYPLLRKILGVMEKYVGRPKMEKNGGVFVVDVEGNPVAHYYENDFTLLSTGIKIGDYMYCGFVVNGFILRLDLTQNPAIASG